MKPIQNPPPPSIGSRSSVDTITNLQDALLFLIEKERIFLRDDEPLSDDERRDLVEELRRDHKQKVFGTGTSNVVNVFRQEYQLEAGEIVDEATAEVLNRLLQESGAFDTPPAKANWLVRGQVVDASGPVNHIQVSLFDRDLFFRRNGANTGQHLGTEITKNLSTRNEDGCFEIAFATAKFAAGDIPREGDTIPDLIFALSKDRQSIEKFQIYRLPDGNGRAEETLVSNDELILGIQARRVEEVRILIPGGTPKRQLSEFERLIHAIEPLLPEPIPADASDAEREAVVSAAVRSFDEEKYRDMSFVQRETGFDRFLIEKLAAASRLTFDLFQDILPASVFYGLARTRSTTDLMRLARLSEDDMRSGLVEATANTPSIIPPFDPPDRLNEVVRTIREVLARKVPTHRVSEGAPSITSLLGVDLSDPDEQATLWRTYADHEGTPAEFWKKLERQPGFADPEKVAKVKCRFELGVLTQNNIPLVNAIRAKHPAMTNLRELAFVLDTREKWAPLLDRRAVSIPDDVPIPDDVRDEDKSAARKASYARSLAGAMQIAHPTAAVANMVATLSRAKLADADPEAVAKFLADAVREYQFDLVAGRIDDLVAEHGDILLKHIDLKDRVVLINQVKRLQRLFRLSAGPESMKVLVEAGFNSARELAELPPQVALDMLTPLLGQAMSKMVLNRANNISAYAIHQYALLNNAVHGEIPGGSL